MSGSGLRVRGSGREHAGRRRQAANDEGGAQHTCCAAGSFEHYELRPLFVGP